MSDIPVLPYNGNSGWGGSEASRNRAETNDSSGLTRQTQKRTLDCLAIAKFDGLIFKELSYLLKIPTHSAASALSNLHKGGLIWRLTDLRDKCSIYVLPEFVNNRQTVAPYAKTNPLQQIIDLHCLAEGHSFCNECYGDFPCKTRQIAMGEK